MSKMCVTHHHVLAPLVGTGDSFLPNSAYTTQTWTRRKKT